MAESSNKAEYVIGVDIGGTKIYAGVFNSSLECIGTARVSTKAQRGADSVIERISRARPPSIIRGAPASKGFPIGEGAHSGGPEEGTGLCTRRLPLTPAFRKGFR